MKKKRVALAAVIGAVLAVAVAVPVVAGGVLRGIPAESGYIRMAPHEATWTVEPTSPPGVTLQADGDSYADPTTYTVDGPSTVRLAFDTKVMLDQTDGPTSWVLAAGKLPRLHGPVGAKAAANAVSQRWTLVQIDRAALWDDPDTVDFDPVYYWDVTPLKTGTAKMGFLAMKGSNVLTAPDWETWHRFSGWELWLVPACDVEYYLIDPDPTKHYYIQTDEHFDVQSDWFLPLLGGPAQQPDYQNVGSN